MNLNDFEQTLKFTENSSEFFIVNAFINAEFGIWNDD